MLPLVAEVPAGSSIVGHGSAAGPVASSTAPAVEKDDAPSQGEPEAGALGASGDEGLEERLA